MTILWWIPAIIPLLGAFVILISTLWPISKCEGAKNQREISESWHKFIIYVFVNTIMCLIISITMWIGATEKTRFNEIWNYKIIAMEHQHRWTEKESRTRQVYDGKDSNGNSKYRTETYYVTETYGPYWYTIDEYGHKQISSEELYQKWSKIWKNEEQIGLKRGSSAGLSRRIDGPTMRISWNNDFETIFPHYSVKRYVNKIRASNSILNYGNYDSSIKSRFPRPADRGNASPVINYSSVNVDNSSILKLSRLNALFGRNRQIHTILVLLPYDSEMDLSNKILAAWQGPNKNELVTFLATDGDNISWVNVGSWMDNTELHAVIRDGLINNKFNIDLYFQLIHDNISLWNRKSFTPINSYIHVKINPSWISIGLILSLTGGFISFKVIENVIVK
jgi:hypothetical protein